MSDVELTRTDGVQVLRLARAAKKNALTGDMYGALADALAAGDADPDVAAHLFAGSGGVFCAGNDIADFLATARGTAGMSMNAVRFIRALPFVKKPMLAAVDGPAVGVGTTLLLHCDLVYATPGAIFSTPFLDLGLVPEAGSSLLAPRLIGPARAFELLVLGEPFSAERALGCGLLNAVVPADDVERVALAAACRLAQKPPQALAAARRLVRGDPNETLARIDGELVAFKERLSSPEAREAFQAFLEKRKPDFKAAQTRA